MTWPWTLLFFLLVPAGFCIAQADGEQGTGTGIKWTGCGITRKALMAEAAAVFEKKTGIHTELSGGGATLGIRKAASGEADIGGSCRPCKPEWTDEEAGVRMTHAAWDALVIFVHPSNPVTGLTTEQVQKIYSGEIRSWKNVGGQDAPIVVTARRGKTSGVGYMARKLLFQDEGADFCRRAILLKSSGPLEEKVESTANAIGISGISSVKKRNVKFLTLDGVAPDKEKVASGDYSLSRPLYLMTRGEPTGATKQFLDWILTPEGQKIISEQGTVNLEEGKELTTKFAHWEHEELIRNHKKSWVFLSIQHP